MPTMEYPPEYDSQFIDNIPSIPPPPYSPRAANAGLISSTLASINLENNSRSSLASGGMSTIVSSLDPEEEVNFLLSSIPWHADAVSYANHQIEQQEFKLVCRDISERNLLKNLDLSRNSSCITDDTMPLVIQSIAANKHLRVLKLGSCSLSTKSGYFLGLYLQVNSSLEILMIQDNALLQDGAAAFFKGLSSASTPRLRALLFSPEANVQPDPTRIPQNTTLRALNLSSNAIMHQGLESVVKACLTHLLALEHLHLNNNSLKDDSAKSLCHLAIHHPTLKTLHLQGNLFTESTILNMDQSLSYSRGIRLIDFRHNLKIKLKSAGVKHKKKIVWKEKHNAIYHIVAPTVLGSY